MPTSPHSSQYSISAVHRQALIPLSKQPGWFDLRQLDKQLPDQPLARALQELSARRRQLIEDARNFFATSDTPLEPPVPGTPQIAGGSTLSEIFSQLFPRYQGIALGIHPPRAFGLHVLVDLMAQPHGLSTIYLIGLLADLHQDDLDRYHAAPAAAMPPELADYVDNYDRQRKHLPDGSLRRLLELAHEQGLRVVALESTVLRVIYSKQPLLPRAVSEIANYYFSLRIAEDQRRAGSGRWLAWLDETSLSQFEGVPGITELNNGIGIRLSYVTPVSDNLLRRLYLRQDRGEEVIDPVGDRYWVKSELLLSSEPQIDVDALNARLANPSSFVILARPDLGEFELRFRATDQTIVIVPVLRDPRAPHRFFIERPDKHYAWDSVTLQPHRSVHALSDSLQRELGMVNAWPGVTPTLDTTASHMASTRPTGWLRQPPTPLLRLTPGQSLPLSSNYELTRELIELLLPQQAHPHGLDTRYEPPGLAPRALLARRLLAQSRAQLLADAEQYFRQARLPIRTPPATPQIGASMPELLEQLLTHYAGIVIGEIHAQRWGKQFLIEQMALLYSKGVRTLYLEQLLTEQHQAMLDKWHAAPGSPIPEALRLELAKIDPEHQVGQDHSFSALVKAAHNQGIAVVAIDAFSSYHSPVLGDEWQRLKLMNFYAMLRIGERQKAQPGAKWVALVGNAHANRLGQTPGLAELTGTVGLRIDGEPVGMFPDTGVWASSMEWGQCFLKSDLVVTHRPLLTDSEINARLRSPGDFAIVYAPQPDRDAYELRYRGARQIAVLPIRRTDSSGHFYLTDTPWPKADNLQFMSLKTLNKALVQIAKLSNVWPGLTPQPITTLPIEQRELTLHPEEVAQQRQDTFEGLRAATLLRMLFFAAEQDRVAFKAGKADWQSELATTPELADGTLDTLKQAFIQQANSASPRRLAALLGAIGARQAQQAEQLAQTWQTQIASHKGTHIRSIGHNRYLSVTDHPQGVCAGMSAHMASAWLQDAAAPGHAYLDAYLDSIEAATQAPDGASARLLDLALVAWATPESKFSDAHEMNQLPLAGVIEHLGRATAPAVFELSIGNHAMLLAKDSTLTSRHYLLADPNFGYCRLPNQQALVDALGWHCQLVRRLFLSGSEREEMSFSLRRFHADLPKQRLFAHAEASWLGTLKLADLSTLSTHISRLVMPLLEDAAYLRLARRLTLQEYRLSLLSLDKLHVVSRMLGDLLTRHQAPQSAVRSHAPVLKIIFLRQDALITLSAPPGEVYPPLRIDGTRHPQDVALLRQLQTLQHEVTQRGTLSLFDRLLHRRQTPLFEVDRDVLTAALPDSALARYDAWSNPTFGPARRT